MSRNNSNDRNNENSGVARQTSSVTERDISFTSDGKNIYGRALIPQSDGRIPTVIFSHGFGGNYEQESTLQEAIATAGIAVYAFDFAGGSGYSPSQSEGETTDMSVLTESRNLRDALSMIRNQDFVDTNNIFLMGASQGGVVTSLTASNDDIQSLIRGVVLLYPAFSLINDAHERFSSENAIPNTYNLMGIEVGKRYFTDVWNIDIFSEISKYRGPVAIFHGTADNLVPLSYSQRAEQAFPHATLTQVPDGGHGFSTSIQTSIAPQIISFITTNRK
ncbi:alpha/beta fold hydrolase [Alloscardovia theropitheci]|uniref:Alpha/beta fold hydrolase n=2 Tax=Alloscardovia theropitheci TaxID=2496842 RepID=A0A4V2MTZ9_9BIFI|nr:alpha/beta fold hydrolase [Alloscardovia theropitheci]